MCKVVCLDLSNARLGLFGAFEMYAVVKERRLQLARKLWAPTLSGEGSAVSCYAV